jgi:hypothetical protein
MDIQRLRNLTTGFLHTEIGHVYQDVEMLTGEEGVMTHHLPNAAEALRPYLAKMAPDSRFWDKRYDPSHTGEIDVPAMDEGERAEFWKRFYELPHPFAGRDPSTIIAVTPPPASPAAQAPDPAPRTAE